MEDKKEARLIRWIGLKAPQFTPSPFNLFMNIPVHDDLLTISFEPPTSKARQYICLKAEMDLVVAFSACPQVYCFSSLGSEDCKREERRGEG